MLMDKLDRGGRMSWDEMWNHLPHVLQTDRRLVKKAGGGVTRMSSEDIIDVGMMVHEALQARYIACYKGEDGTWRMATGGGQRQGIVIVDIDRF